MRSNYRRLVVLIVPLALAFLAVPQTGWADVKLYLKDGTYQLVKNYEVHGDRVRYYSVERSEWEEMPASLVDFDTTKRVQQEEKASEQKELEEAREIAKERFERPAETGFEVAPGIHLPKDEGVFAFDGTRLIRMLQSSGEIVTDKKRLVLNLALPGPLLKNRALVILAGPEAAVRILMTQPTFFVQSADGWGARAELIPVRSGKQSRVLERVQSGMGVGKSGELRDVIPVERTQVATGLFKLRPIYPLAEGEYALGELIQQKLNLEVWDFGIGRGKPVKGPENASPGPMSEHPPGETPQAPQVPPASRRPQVPPPASPNPQH